MSAPIAEPVYSEEFRQWLSPYIRCRDVESMNMLFVMNAQCTPGGLWRGSIRDLTLPHGWPRSETRLALLHLALSGDVELIENRFQHHSISVYRLAALIRADLGNAGEECRTRKWLEQILREAES